MAGWTNTETFKFIELYQNEPSIWNPKNKNHKDKAKVNDAWLRIADALGAPVAEIKKKKESLMASFRFNHKKVLASLKSGAGEDEIFKPIWTFYDALATFMSDVYDCKSLLTSEDHIQDEDSAHGAHPSSSHMSDEFTTGEDRENAAPISIPLIKRRSHKPLDLHETNSQVKNALSTLDNVLKENKKQPTEDDCDLYGRLLAKKLRKYSEFERQAIMYDIDGMLLKKRRSLDNQSIHRSYVTSPSQIIISSNRPSHITHSNRSMHIVDNRPFSAESNYSIRVPSPADNAMRYRPSSTISNYSATSPTYPYQTSPTDTSPPQYFTNQSSSAQLLHIPHESQESYHHQSQTDDILVQALEAIKD